MVIFGHRD